MIMFGDVVRRSLALALPVALAACGAGQAIVRDPIESKCKEAKLRGCEDFADGVAVYIDGDKRLGYDKVKQGVGVNMDDPEKIKMFAAAMKLLAKAPAVGPYVAQLRPIIDMMDAAADDAIKRGATRKEEREERRADRAPTKGDKEKPGPTATAEAHLSSTSSLRGGTIVVPGNPKAKSCPTALSQTAAGGSEGSECVRAFEGPLVLTEVHTPGGCEHDLFVISGDQQTPNWWLFVPAGTTSNVAGGSLLVPADEQLVVLARPRKGNLRASANCSVTWGGVKL